MKSVQPKGRRGYLLRHQSFDRTSYDSPSASPLGIARGRLRSNFRLPPACAQLQLSCTRQFKGCQILPMFASAKQRLYHSIVGSNHGAPFCCRLSSSSACQCICQAHRKLLSSHIPTRNLNFHHFSCQCHSRTPMKVKLG